MWETTLYGLATWAVLTTAFGIAPPGILFTGQVAMRLLSRHNKPNFHITFVVAMWSFLFSALFGFVFTVLLNIASAVTLYCGSGQCY